MTPKEIGKLLGNKNYEYKVNNLGNGKTQVIIQKKLIKCAMCKTEIKQDEGIKKQDRRVVALIVERKYCKNCASTIDDILHNISASHKEPIGTMV